MAAFGAGADGRGEMDFKMFSELVMGSSTSAATSIGHYKKASRYASNDTDQPQVLHIHPLVHLLTKHV